MKSFEEIEKTGEWWLQSGWESCTGLRGKKYSPEEISAGIETLKKTFTAEWFRDVLNNPVKNIVVANLIHSGPPSNDFLINLSRMIQLLEHSQGFPTVCKRLKGNESESAFFELEMAAVSSESSIRVEFPKSKKRKTPDIIAHFPDQTVAIECKHLDKEQWELWADNLHLNVHRAVTQVKPDQQFKIQLKLAPSLSDIHFNHEKEPAINDAIQAAILKHIYDVIAKILAASALPVNFGIPGIVSGTIFPAGAQVEEFTKGVPISSTAKLRRIFTNAFLEAEKQLPNDMAGICAVYTDYLPDPTFARIIFDAVTSSVRERFQHITALLIFPLQTYFQWTPPLLFENRYSSLLFRDLRCSSVMKNYFGLQEC